METSQSNLSSSSNLAPDVDRRPLYIWLIVLVTDIGLWLSSSVSKVYHATLAEVGDLTSDSVSGILSTYLLGFSALLLVISVFASVIPVLLSGSKLGRRAWLAFGIPSLLLLPIPYLTWHMYNCTGKFCDTLDQALIFIFGISAVLFTIFYLIGKFFRKWNAKVALVFLCLESVFLVGAVVFLAYFAYFDFSLASFIAGEKKDSVKAAQFCDSLPDSRKGNCWYEVVRSNPGIDVCSWSKSTIGREACTYTRKINYRGSEPCESIESPKYPKATEEERLALDSKEADCWKDKARIYPGLDVCNVNASENHEKCRALFKTPPQ